MQRLGLCCLFYEEPIRFRTTTVAYVKRIENPLEHLSKIIVSNVQALKTALEFCVAHKISAFRINSQLFPVYTHLEVGYALEKIPDYERVIASFAKIKTYAQEQNIRLSFHPDQFVVLSSPREEVVERSIADLEYHGLMAELVGADVINIHGGGGYGNKKQALDRFSASFEQLSKRVQERLTLENDDKVYTPSDLLPICKRLGVPLVYDVHHHRCLGDGLSIEEATAEALSTWNREPLFHVSSPKNGWGVSKPQLHHDFIDCDDVPSCWKKVDPLTIDVEAKAKELAVIKLTQVLKGKGWKLL